MGSKTIAAGSGKEGVMEKLLVVENVQSLREQLRSLFEQEYILLEAADRHQAIELFLSQTPKVVLLDLGLPPDQEGTSEGFLCLKWMVEARPATKVVVMTGGERETGYRAIGCGAYDFCQRPVEVEALKIIIHRAFHLTRIEEQKTRLQDALERSSAGIEGIAGQLTAIKALMASLQMSAAWDLPDMDVRVSELMAARSAAKGATVPAGGARGGAIVAQPEVEVTPPPGNLTLREVRDMVEKGMISAAFGNCGGNMARASEMLGVSRPALYDLMKKHGLQKPPHHRHS